MTLFFICIGLVVIQRLTELNISKNHSKKMFERGAVEYDSRAYKFIVLMHTCFFISVIIEFLYFGKHLNLYWYVFAVIFFSAQLLRYWAIISLGDFWNTRIIILKNSQLVRKGPYKFLRHPNYMAVAAEIFSIPLIFSCYLTAIIFTILNFLVLRRRIKIENTALFQNNLL